MPAATAPLAESVWASMDTGGFAGALSAKILRFNGGLFKERHAIPLDAEQLGLLIDAAEKDWTDVEPAIFGTLLERALNPRERTSRRDHSTPGHPPGLRRAVVLPTVIEPLRERWSNAQAAAVTLDGEDALRKREVAVPSLFHPLAQPSRALRRPARKDQLGCSGMVRCWMTPNSPVEASKTRWKSNASWPFKLRSTMTPSDPRGSAVVGQNLTASQGADSCVFNRSMDCWISGGRPSAQRRTARTEPSASTAP